METNEYITYSVFIIGIIGIIVYILYLLGYIDRHNKITIDAKEMQDEQIECQLKWDNNGNLSNFVCQQKEEY